MNCSNYTQNDIYSYYEKKISDLLASNKKEEAQSKAFEWLQEYVNSLCITVPWNWKIAKKQIAAYFFGAPQSVRLHYYDDFDRGIHFIMSHPNQNVRCSFYKFDTACHSESRKIDAATINWLKEIKENMSQKDVVEIFVECSTQMTTCFRRLSLQYNESISYEMGYGQAMYVFEAERGKHDVVGINYFDGKWKLKESLDPLLIGHLDCLIKNHEQYLAVKTQCICYYLGIPQISIEGYFNTATPAERPIIVDIDLPFDKAFF